MSGGVGGNAARAEGTARPIVRVVQEPNYLWHLRRDGETDTLCGMEAAGWPLVLRWDTRTGITCGKCLYASGAMALKQPGRGAGRHPCDC